MKNNLEKLFNPTKVAIVGASDREGSVGNAITRNLLNLGYQGQVFLVNPKYSELLGKKCYANLNDIKEEIDLAVVVIPAAFVNETIKSATKVKNFIVISAGFSETGKEGQNREAELLKIAEEKGVNILGPNCLGLISPKLSLNASFASGLPESGGVALISQSGALIVAMLDMAKKEQIKFSQIVSIGNKMQLDEVDLLEYLVRDSETKVVALYLEGIKDGQKFIKVAQKFSRIKPIIVLKAGKSEKSQKAIASHTGSLAGNEEIANVAFKKAGVIQADNLEDFFVLIKLASNFKNLVNENCAIITNAGGPGVLATDAFKNKNIKLKELSEEIKRELREFLPKESSVENPIDLLGDAGADRYKKTLEILEKDEVGNIICIMTAQDQTPTIEIAKTIVEFRKKTQKNILPIFIGGEKIDKAIGILKENEVPNFDFPNKMIDALDELIFGEEQKIIVNKIKPQKSLLKKIFSWKKSDIVAEAVLSGKKALLFDEAEKLMKCYDIPVVDFVNVNELKEKDFEAVNFPVVLKVDSENVLHKTEKRGLILDIKDKDSLKEAIAEVSSNFPKENAIIQPMVSSEAELILGLKRDAIFGPVVVYGLGGIYTEIFKMVDFIILPADKNEIKKSIEGSKIAFLFKETRGKIVGNLDEMVDLIFNFACLVEENEKIKEIDINPLLITKEGKLKAVDVKVIL